MSKRWLALPTGIAELIEWMSPGRVGPTETATATTARQFYVVRSVRWTICVKGRDAYKAAGVTVAPVRVVHRRDVDAALVQEPVLRGDKVRGRVELKVGECDLHLRP